MTSTTVPPPPPDPSPVRTAPTFRPDVMLRREGRAGYVLIAPATLLLTLFYLYPLAQTVVYSFTDWNPASPAVPQSVGFENYAALADAGGFAAALGHTGLYVVVVVPAAMAIGLFLAVVMNTPFRGRSVYRALIFLPFIAPMVGSAIVFSYLLTPLGGVVNSVVEGFGGRAIPFLTTTPWAMVSVLVFSIWHQVGYTMVIYSAALSGIPGSYYEAATLDGAGAWRRFRSISFPLLAPTSGFLAITGIIGALQVFTQVYVLTGGGPLGSTSTVIHWIYQQGFVFFHGGLATAASVVLLLIGIAVTLFQLLVLSRRDTVELS